MSLGAALPVVAGGRRDRRPRGGGGDASSRPATLAPSSARGDHRRRHALHHGRRALRAAGARRRGARPAAHQRGRAVLEPVVRGHARAGRRRGRGGAGVHRARLDRRRAVPPGGRGGRRRRRAGRRAPARRARRDHQQHRGRRPRRGGRRRPAQGGRGHRRASPHVRRRGDDDQARDRDPRRLGRQRVLALRVARLRRGQDGVRAPHGQFQRLHRRGGARGRPRRLRLPHQVAPLERPRLQLPDRPLRDHLRGPLRRRRPRRRRGAGARVQHREHGHLGHRHVQRFHAAVPHGHGPGAAAGVEARRPPHRPAGHGDAALRVRPEVRHRPAGDVPGHRRPPRRQLHRLPRGQAVRAAAHRAQGGRAHGPAQDLRVRRRRPLHQPERRRRARPHHRRVHGLRESPPGPSPSATTRAGWCVS